MDLKKKLRLKTQLLLLMLGICAFVVCSADSKSKKPPVSIDKSETRQGDAGAAGAVEASAAAAGHPPSNAESDDAEAALPEQWRACQLVRSKTLTLDCRRRGLVKVPADPPAGVTAVRLGGNVFRELRSVPLRGVVRLELIGCAVADIRNYALAEARSLEHLDLTNNELTRLDPEVLKPLESLQDLLLAQNHLIKMPDLPCDQLPRLRSINLAANDIDRLQLPTEYSQCASLHSLTLSANPRLTRLLSGDLAALTGKSRLRVLKLASCPLTQLDKDALDPVRDSLQHLDLSGNQLATRQMLAGLSRLRDLRWLRLHRVTLTSLQPADLLAGGGGLAALRSLQVTCANAGGRPLLLPEKYTFSTATKHVEQLQLDYCGLANFDYQATGLSNLHSLDLAGNRLTDVPLGLPQSLTHLGLQDNRISHVTAAHLQRLDRLRRLDLSGNRLASVSGFKFVCLTPQLAELELDELELRLMERQDSFDKAPPEFPARALAQLIGKKKRKQLLRSYAASLLASMQAFCARQPPPVIDTSVDEKRPPPPPASIELNDPSVNENSAKALQASGEDGKSQVSVFILFIAPSVGLAVLVFLAYRFRRRICLAYRRLRGSNTATSAAAGAAADSRGLRRGQYNSRDTLMSSNFQNRTYERIGGQLEMSMLGTHQPNRQQTRDEERQPLASSSPENPEPQQQQQQQNQIPDSVSHNSVNEEETAQSDEAAVEAGRLSRAEGGGGRSPSLRSIQLRALLIGLSTDFDSLGLKDTVSEAASCFEKVDENSCDEVPEISNWSRIFILLTEDLLKNSNLMQMLNLSLKDSKARNLVKILCCIKKDTPEFGGQLKEACPPLHSIYLKYRIRLIDWHSNCNWDYLVQLI